MLVCCGLSVRVRFFGTRFSGTVSTVCCGMRVILENDISLSKQTDAKVDRRDAVQLSRQELMACS